MTPTDAPMVGEPERWILIFSRKPLAWWASALACGRYKHVRAVGYVAGLKTWIFYDVQFGRTQIALARDGEAFERLFEIWTDRGAADLVCVPQQGKRKYGPPSPFLCTTAIAHLIGLPRGALRPDALWRHCLAHGGEVINGPGTPPA